MRCACPTRGFFLHGSRRTSLTATIVKITQVDTAVFYAGGTSEEYLGKIGWKERGLVVHTKLYPWPVRPDHPEIAPPLTFCLRPARRVLARTSPRCVTAARMLS